MTSQQSFALPSRSDDSWVENQPIASRSVGTFRVGVNLMTLPVGIECEVWRDSIQWAGHWLHIRFEKICGLLSVGMLCHNIYIQSLRALRDCQLGH